ncbi:hypothetical protein BH11MYX1_BH11MYX1_41970 [soil metagenome]
MRLALVTMLLVAGTAHADPVTVYAPAATTTPPRSSLWNAEMRLGYGVQITSGDGMTAPRSAPLTIEADAAFLLQDQPRLFGYAGGIAETLDRSAIGGSGGVELEQGPMRMRGGAVYFFAPYTLFGVTASAGGCRHVGSGGTRACLDLALTEYFAGTDLVKGHATTQVQLVFGMVFDGN